MSRRRMLALSILVVPLGGCSVYGRLAVGPSIDTHRGAGVEGMLAAGFSVDDPQSAVPEATFEVGGGASAGPVRRSLFFFPAIDVAATPRDGDWVLRGGPRLGARVLWSDAAGDPPPKGMFALGAAVMGARRFGKGGTRHELGLDARCFGTFGAAPYGGMVCALSPAYTITTQGWKGPSYMIK
ncbi:MAG: hypothetical protein QM820_22080 [Minicystis sp.]